MAQKKTKIVENEIVGAAFVYEASTLEFIGCMRQIFYPKPFFIAAINEAGEFNPVHEIVWVIKRQETNSKGVSKEFELDANSLYYEYNMMSRENGERSCGYAVFHVKIDSDKKVFKVFRREIPEGCLKISPNGKIKGKVNNANILKTLLFDRVYGNFILKYVEANGLLKRKE